MAISYTNNTKAITDALEVIMYSSVVPVIFSNHYQPEYLKRGEYIRLWLESTENLGTFAKGDLVLYNFKCLWYFNLNYYRKEIELEDKFADSYEHLKRLMFNNKNYNMPTSYVWHHAQVDVINLNADLTESDDVEDIKGYENIRAMILDLSIIRANFNE